MAMNPIIDKDDRVAIIDQEVKRPIRKEQLNFRNRMTELPVVRLEIGLPIYRIKNGRTSVEQQLHINKHDLDESYFEGSEENASVQAAQELILLRLSKDPKASIFDELAHRALQTETLLLTAHGTVLNGNRRLAAMRRLFSDDPEKYQRFSHVDVAILPRGAREKDLELLEAELQLAPETRLEYGWIERRLKLRHQVRVLKISRALIKSTYRFKKELDINIELNQLDLAEEYLAEYLHKPRAYEQVANSEQLFKDLEESLRRSKLGRESEEARRTVGFVLAKEAGNLPGRVYRFKPVFDKQFSRFAEIYAQREGISLRCKQQQTSSDQQRAPSSGTSDPLQKLSTPEQSTPAIDYSEFTTKLKDLNNSKDVGRSITDIAEELRDEGKERSTGMAALKSAQMANTKLQEIDLEKADPSTLEAITAQLDTAIARAKSLKVQAIKIIGASKGSVQ